MLLTLTLNHIGFNMLALIVIAKMITFVVLGVAACFALPATLGAIVLALTSEERIDYVSALASGWLTLILSGIAGAIIYTLASAM